MGYAVMRQIRIRNGEMALESLNPNQWSSIFYFEQQRHLALSSLTIRNIKTIYWIKIKYKVNFRLNIFKYCNYIL